MPMFGPPEEEALLDIVRPDQMDEVMKDYLRSIVCIIAVWRALYPGIDEFLWYAKDQGKKIGFVSLAKG